MEKNGKHKVVYEVNILFRMLKVQVETCQSLRNLKRMSKRKRIKIKRNLMLSEQMKKLINLQLIVIFHKIISI